MQYKTVAAPMGLIIKAGDPQGCEKAVASYAELIQKEAVDGWELDMITTITVDEKPGCVRAALGSKVESTEFNMLVFKKRN